MAERELEIGGGRAILPELLDAIDLASDQGQPTWLTDKGKRIARIVTVEDAELLDALYGLCKCPPDGNWRADCPMHGNRRR
jgi:antitoxin (DNA-binding transcriptional repressor) of toxin-antitoxin stability system